MEHLGVRLYVARERAQLTQQKLAEKAGTAVRVVSTIETGEPYEPGVEHAKRLATACGVSLDWLLGPATDDEIAMWRDREQRRKRLRGEKPEAAE